jgi:hypothetical protein
MRRWLAPAAVAFIALSACGSFGLRAHPITLAFKSGDSYSYKLHVALDYKVAAQGMTVPFKLDLTSRDTLKVNSVDADGTADVTLNLTDITIKSTLNGTDDSHVAKSETVELKISSDGHILNVNGNDITGGSLPDFTGTGSGLISALLPSGDVKVGDTWSRTYDTKPPKGTGSIHIKTDSKYLRDENAGGVDAAVVESKITSAVDITLDSSSLRLPAPSRAGASSPSASHSIALKGTLTSTVTSWIDTAGHRIVKTHSTGSTKATLDLGSAPASGSPLFNGPLTIAGTQSVEIDPA